MTTEQGQKPVTSGSTVFHLWSGKPGLWRTSSFLSCGFGDGEREKKLLTLLVETSSQKIKKKKKKESTPKYSKYYLNVVNPTSIAKRQQKLEPRNTCLTQVFYLQDGVECPSADTTLSFCPKHPESTWNGFILLSIYLGFRKKKTLK